MVTATLAIRFWLTVEDCLVIFHGFARPDAAAMVTNLWRRLPWSPTGTDSSDDIIYHAEPFDIACNLAGRPLSVLDHQSEYQAMQVRNGMSPDYGMQPAGMPVDSRCENSL